MEIVDRGLTDDEARTIAGWRYEPPYDLYDTQNPQVLLSQDYRPVYANDLLIGFVCFGAEARVRGQHEEPGILDVGAGLRPDQVGQGVGTALMPTVIGFAREHFAPRGLRAAIAAFNIRSQQLCRSAGFVAVREFDGPNDRRFVELVLDMDSAGGGT